VVREYAEQYYIPAAKAYCDRATGNGSAAVPIVAWQHRLAQAWSALRFGEMGIQTAGGEHIFTLKVHLNGLDPVDVSVEIYDNGLGADAPIRQEMQPARQLKNSTSPPRVSGARLRRSSGFGLHSAYCAEEWRCPDTN
jgi:starch phosphorylase